MKWRGRKPAEQHHEACGIWLDTSGLKKQKVQTRIAKLPLRVLNRLSPYSASTKAPLPCTKQTTISTFFSAHQGDERKTKANKRLLAVAPGGATHQQCRELSPGERNRMAASLPQLVQEHHQQAEQKSQGLHFPPRASAHAQSNSRSKDTAMQRENTIEGEDPFSSVTRPLEEEGCCDHTALFSSPLRERNGGWRRERKSTGWSHCSRNQEARPCESVTAWRRCRHPSSSSEHCFVDSTEAENINPQLEGNIMEVKSLKGFHQTVARPCDSDYNKGNSQGELTSPLFTQDSEGHSVISHNQGKLPLQNKLLQNKANPAVLVVAAPNKGCNSAPKGPHLSTEAIFFGGAGLSQLSYDLLFTEDSEGNRVIKHHSNE
ncbi:aurora kinase A and ninein-interacting protein-like [Hemicordylus capensis]|uniref:aurora kinase A and ninein-interacting protein-like n=1 Tax=Hemicordylus capensis TaxID=884348 RepID=UPI0023035C2D|nr:aurora kinase A and ninein-interacting protein-like [Hemicordylus capensis]